MKKLKDGPVLIHLEVPEPCIRTRLLPAPFYFPLCCLIPEQWQQIFTWSDYIGFCLLAFWWRTTKMCRRPICFDGVHCSVDYAAPEFWRGTEGDPWIGGTSYWGNHPYQKRTLVQIEEEIWFTLTYKWCTFFLFRIMYRIWDSWNWNNFSCFVRK